MPICINESIYDQEKMICFYPFLLGDETAYILSLKISSSATLIKGSCCQGSLIGKAGGARSCWSAMDPTRHRGKWGLVEGKQIQSHLWYNIRDILLLYLKALVIQTLCSVGGTQHTECGHRFRFWFFLFFFFTEGNNFFQDPFRQEK